ncbi:MAG: hypothetical protein EOO25_18085 [Comamonadaceae bacterium]|nr:MAG: hypothetical protein EOO25_18085 [Comamonadaceae bacterium]
MALLGACLLAACGGGGGGGDGDGDNPQPPNGGGTVLTAGVAGLVGDWLENGCVTTGGQSFRRVLRATQLTPTSIAYFEGVATYGNGRCEGVRTVVGPSRMGDVVFTRSESNVNVAANWGEFTTVTNTRFSVIWAKKSEITLCLLGDEKPSILPTLDAVQASLKTLPDLGCFTRQ